MGNIYANDIDLELFCADIVEGARDYFKANPPKKGNKTVRERVEHWVSEDLLPAVECALDGTFEVDDEENT
jgi:acetyl-CoA carboxylase carboxyltransferase component